MSGWARRRRGELVVGHRRPWLRLAPRPWYMLPWRGHPRHDLPIDERALRRAAYYHRSRWCEDRSGWPPDIRAWRGRVE